MTFSHFPAALRAARRQTPRIQIAFLPATAQPVLA